ncbi:unnamed protein product [Prunus armeniaca]
MKNLEADSQAEQTTCQLEELKKTSQAQSRPIPVEGQDVWIEGYEEDQLDYEPFVDDYTGFPKIGEQEDWTKEYGEEQMEYDGELDEEIEAFGAELESLLEGDLGINMVFVNTLLEEPVKNEIIALMHDFKDCFVWHYHQMPGLDRGLVEHKLPIKEGYLLVKQARRMMSMETELKVKEKVERLVKAASPKDEYPMPMADMLVDGAAHNQMLSFMDGNDGYNQIMRVEEDIHKTAFMCLGHIGTFEYIVMPFGLRNAGATYQRAMNSVFHDMIGHSLEVYIDDVVIKFPKKGDHVSNLKKAFLRMRQHKLKMNPKKCVFGV